MLLRNVGEDLPFYPAQNPKTALVSFLPFWTLIIKAQRSFATRVIIYKSKRRNIAEDLDLQWQRCEKSKILHGFLSDNSCYLSHNITEVYILLTVHPGMILVNNQLDTQFFTYVYFYSLHFSGSQVPIIRRIIVSMRNLVYVTMCRWPSGMKEHMLLHTRLYARSYAIQTVIYTEWHKPRFALKQ